MNLGERLREIRQAGDLTQEQLAERAQIEQSYLSKLENGRARPSTAVLQRLALALDVQPDALTGARQSRRRALGSGRLGWALVGSMLFGAGVLLGSLLTLHVSRGLHSVSVADLVRAQDLAPQGVFVDRLSTAEPGAVRVTGRYRARHDVIRYAGKLLQSGILGHQLRYVWADAGEFRIDIGAGPADLTAANAADR